MTFTTLCRSAAALVLLAGSYGLHAQQHAATSSPPAARSGAVEVYASIATQEKRMRQGSLTAETLARAYIARIAAMDQSGPDVNTVLEVNPDALEIARQRDMQRAADPARASPLLGIPVLLKDNIDTGDRMQTSAGSLALVGQPAPTDATVALKLRAAGMVILGKTNLSEWANFRSSHSTSGWSGRGGLTRNPYVLTRTACGSSSGSAAAVAAGFVTVAIGTETNGSIICPSTLNGIVGIKPTMGLVSRAGIVPISQSQDTAGPMARTVADAARLLTAMAGSDPKDPATREASLHATDYTRFLDPNGLRGKRIGVVRNLGGSPTSTRMLDKAVAAMRAAGAIIVDPVELPHAHDYGQAEFTTLLYEFKHDINTYLAQRKGLKVHTLADLIAFNRAHAEQEMPWFGQSLFLKAEKMGPLTDPAYLKARDKARRLAGPEGIDAALAAHHLDALVAAGPGPAWVSDLVDGDHFVGAGSASPAAVSGYPSITVPAGMVHGLPMGVVFFAGKWSEPTLIAIAYGFEQHTHARQRPHFYPTVMDVPTAAELALPKAPAAKPAAMASAPAPASSTGR